MKPEKFQDLMEVYWQNEKIDELLDFLTTQHNSYSTDEIVNGNLYFFKGVILFDKEEFEYAKVNFEKSREIFENVFKPNHSVFEVIDAYINEI